MAQRDHAGTDGSLTGLSTGRDPRPAADAQATIDAVAGSRERPASASGRRAVPPAPRAAAPPHLPTCRLADLPTSALPALRAAALPLLALAATAGWLLLLPPYSLLGNRDNTHFAFEKIPGHFGSPTLRATLVVFVALALAWAVGWRLLAGRRRLSRLDTAGVVAAVVGPGLANVLLYPVGALDAFNYLVELKLTYHFGENPYLVTFAAFRHDPFALPAFLVEVPLFYGPAWLLASGLPGLVVGYVDPIVLLLALKGFHLALLGLTGFVLFRAAGGGKAGWLAAYVFAANPLVLFEGVGNAHNDVLVALFLVAGLAALRSRSLLAGPALALSAAVKFFTAALGPLFVAAAWRERRRWGWRRLAATLALAAVATAAVFAPFWAEGAMLGGLRRGATESQEMDHVSPLSLAKQVAAERRATLPLGFPPRLPWDPCAAGPGSDAGVGSGAGVGLWDVNVNGPPAVVGVNSAAPNPWGPCRVRWPTPRGVQELIERAGLAAFAAAALAVAVAVGRGRSADVGAAVTLLLFALLATNLYPWYLIPVVAALAPVVALTPGRRHVVWLVAATALGLAYYPAYVFARFDAGWTTLGRHLFLALFLTVPILAYLGAGLLGAVRSRRVLPAVRRRRLEGTVSASPAD
jgi:hypothetical protein